MRPAKLLLAVLLLGLQLSSAAVLCQLDQATISQDGIELSSFKVEGPSELLQGDKVTVTFTLRNVAQQDYTLGDDGIFIASRTDYSNIETLYSTRENSLFKDGESISVKKEVALTDAGTVEIWPSYHLLILYGNFNQGQQYYDAYAPMDWVDCKLEVQQFLDKDVDGIEDAQDNCPQTYNPKQEDTDNDGMGDACDKEDNRDNDGDGIQNYLDKCPEEKEVYNNLEDEDGCPDSTAPNLTITITPEDPQPGDEVKIRVESLSPEKTQKTAIFLGNRPVRTCPSPFCSFSFVATSFPLPAIAGGLVDDGGDVRIEGLEEGIRVPDLEDDDEDGVPNSFDNCPQEPNPDQEDIDEDGHGDACDLCSITSSSPDGSLEGLRTMTDWSYIDENGCGIYDGDGGLGFFTASDIKRQKRDDEITCSETEVYVPGAGYRTMTVCTGNNYEIVERDYCRNDNVLREYYLNGTEISYEDRYCSGGCVDGACICPKERDGGLDFYEPSTLAPLSATSFADSCIDNRTLKEAYTGVYRFVGEDGLAYESCFPGVTNYECPTSCQENEAGLGYCVCEDTDGGLNYSVRGSAGTSEDFCLDRRRLREYFTIRGETDNITTCTITYRNVVCEGLCSEGRCLEPSCFDNIQNQGEEGIDCGGPCEASCTQYLITGRLLYEEADAFANRTVSRGFKPARLVKVGLYKGSEKLKDGLTDNEGRFYITISRSALAPGEELHIRAKAHNYAARVERDFDGENEYILWRSTIERTAPESGSVIDFGDLRVGNNRTLEMQAFVDGNPNVVEGGAQYFNIAETILVAREYVDNRSGGGFEDSISRVDVQYPDSQWNFYDSFWEEITLTGQQYNKEWLDFGYVDETIVHEYGHHIQTELAVSDNPEYIGDGHSLCGRVGAYETAFSEGFADYLAAIVYAYHRDPSDPHFLSPTRQTSPANLEGGCPTNDGYREGSVLAVLWDVADDPSNPVFSNISTNESFDSMGNETFILRVLDGEMDNAFDDAPDICEMKDCVWPYNLFTSILDAYNIACGAPDSCGGS